MNPITDIARTALATTLAGLALAGTAEAAVIHVSTTGANNVACGPAASPCRTVNYAQLFRTTNDPDTIQVAAGTYDTSGVNLPAAKTTGDTIAGAGINGLGTILRHPGGGPNEVLKLDVPQTVRNLTLLVPDGLAGNHRPLLINSGADGSRFEDVAARAENGTPAAVAEVNGAGVVIFDRFSATGDHTGDGLSFSGAIGSLVRDSFLVGGSSGPANALAASGNSSVTVLRSGLRRIPGGASFDAVVGSVDSDLTIDSSLITGGQKGVAFQASPGHLARLTLRNATIDTKAAGVKDSGTDVSAVYVRTTMPGAAEVQARVERSILVEDSYAFLEAGSAVSLNCFDSDVPAQSTALIHCDGANGNASSPVGSLFADTGDGDWSLKTGSPAIDASSAAAPVGLESATDRIGKPRAQDGNGDCVVRVDRGAFEFAAANPSCPGGGGAGGGGAGGQNGGATPPADAKPVLDRVSLSKRAFRTRGRGRGTRVRFRVSELTKVAVTVERRRGKRYVKVGGFTYTSTKGSKSRFWSGVVARRPLARGSYRLRLRARDAKGQLSAERRVSFTVRAR